MGNDYDQSSQAEFAAQLRPYECLLFQAKGAYNTNEVVKVKRLFFIVVLVIIFVGLPLLHLSDTIISSDDTATPGNEAAGSMR